MERPKTFIGHCLDLFTQIYCFLIVSIRRPFYSSHRGDSSACGAGPLSTTMQNSEIEVLTQRDRVDYWL